MQRFKIIEDRQKIMTLTILIIGIIISHFFIQVAAEVSVEIRNNTLSNQVNSTENKTGTFFVSNTSAEVLIVRLDVIPQIGQKWNVTLKLDSNSTTSIECQAKPGSNLLNMWEGAAQFTLNVGETITHQYVSHVCGDNLGWIMLAFYLNLSNTTAKVSGTYLAVLLFLGYPPPRECEETGQTIVSDITEWLSNQSTAPSFEPAIILYALLIVVLVIPRKRN